MKLKYSAAELSRALHHSISDGTLDSVFLPKNNIPQGPGHVVPWKCKDAEEDLGRKDTGSKLCATKDFSPWNLC